MAGKISFYLKEPKATEDTLILLQMMAPDGRVKRSIEKKIHPASWSTDTQRPDSGWDRSLQDIDRYISEIMKLIDNVKFECKRNNRLVSKADIHHALDIFLQSTRSEKKRDEKQEYKGGIRMIEDFELLIGMMRTGEILTPGKAKKRYTESTLKNYEKSVRYIQAFYKDEKLFITYPGINLELYNKFIAWCHGRDYANNSIGVFVKCWKRLLRLAFSKGWHSNTIWESEDFMILKEDTDDIYLDDSKIEKLYKAKLQIRKYDIARDWAVLDAFLGLRISDLQKVTAEDFKGKNFHFVNQKTGAKVVIPIHPFVRSIIKKWQGLPTAMHDTDFNDHIKQVAKRSKLNARFIYVVTKGGKVQQFSYQEWEMVSAHTFRRSFITNLLRRGVPHAQVMRLAGIKRYETLMRYYKQTSEEVAEEAAGYSFFKEKSN